MTSPRDLDAIPEPGSFAEDDAWEPVKLDHTVPSIARAYDYLLGGKDNFDVDRQVADFLEKSVFPEIRWLSRANRDFLGRAVDTVARAGVDQFLDLGSGLPTAENTHQIAQRVHPGAAVVYVDNDPSVLAHGRALLADNERTAVLSADLTDVDAVLGDPETRRLIDLGRPVCVMIVSLLHCIPDDKDPFGVMRRYLDRVPSGSHLVFSHIVSDDPARAAEVTEKVLGFGGEWGRVRSPEEAERIADGLELIEPGVVEASTWRTALDPRRRPADPSIGLWEHAGVAVKP
ncbi:SAM-dependent methyltransferase [Allonocardiopsis opalescens]|uniref:S-adenosyl methyltransferase n=1 Tax=Allonocardiopsis opalescens TaxID=1144618 RepID=A0A2T0Q773_9ACTN|nr:SAM-dependent methyltransferase [Allonocardiopsis opalescens]PRX99679.1 S-adenosyl methyltransferase [Allonocardiopsis opalescens]